MRYKFFIIILFFITFYISLYCQDNFYGDYLIAGVKKTVSLDLEEANLVDVLKVLSQQIGLNFVSTEAVRDRKLTLYLEGVPLKEAMDIIFKANNLAYDYYPEANIFVVKEMGKPSIELKTKVYYLKYARVKSSRIQREITDKIEEEEGVTSGETIETEEGTEEGIKEAVKKVLTEYGKVTEDPLTNSLIVVDVPSQFPIIDELIKKLDIPLPRVLIEVEMLDVSRNTVDKLGVKYTQGIYGKFTAGAYKTPFPFPKRFLNSINWSKSPERTLTLGTLDLQSFEIILQFLSRDTSTKFLARPRILTLSNETAEVTLTADEAIGVTTTTTEGGTTTQNIERTEAGTKLRVTPQINLETKEVTLFVEIFTREAKDSGISVTGLVGNIKNPEERGTKAVIRLKDGETLMLGGLIKKEKEATITKIPILGDIPFLGRFFRYKDKDKDKERELLVFLTPHIIEEEAFFHKKLSLHREQLDSARKESIRLTLDKFSKN
jgi:type II secretory pathway component GspD/PulD (secretin)